ncbi:MAG: serine/threonine-protein phosphatase [candidate division KSB1 bacterium]|nr:serine/threonine-protein phosphatase [candidate division KSB1 bacterium]
MSNIVDFIIRLLSEAASAVRQVFKETHLLRDLHSIYAFYLSPEERSALQKMRPIKRSVYLALWFFKSILNKLSTVRRILLIVALMLLIGPDTRPQPVPAFVLLFLILLLELKDKLLADDELRAGRAVQAAMRPKACPEISGWDSFFYTRSANHVGGDLIDCVSQGNSVIFSIGDVSGKGLPAALMMAQLQSAVHALAAQGKTQSPVELVAALNRLCVRSGMRNTFASFILLWVEPDSNRLRLVNAGHLPPLILSTSGLRECGKGGPALGLSADFSYQEMILELDKGDLLVLYTDGIPDARNSNGIFYGEERFFRLLGQADCSWSARQLGETIISAVNRFVDNAPQTDDITLLILKRRE